MNRYNEKFYVFFFLVFVLFSCHTKESCSECKACLMFENVERQTLGEAIQINNLDTIKSTRNTDDLKKSMKVITEKYGEQWDFCNCVVKGDSLNKALNNEKLSDKELDKLLTRFDEIDKKCQAFKIIDPNRTPKERAQHEKKVKKCLKENGIM